VAAEGGDFEADSAAPIARKVFDAWLLGKPPVPAKPTGESEPVAVPAGTPPPVDFSNVQGTPGVAVPASAPVAGAIR